MQGISSESEVHDKKIFLSTTIHAYQNISCISLFMYFKTSWSISCLRKNVQHSLIVLAFFPTGFLSGKNLITFSYPVFTWILQIYMNMMQYFEQPSVYLPYRLLPHLNQVFLLYSSVIPCSVSLMTSLIQVIISSRVTLDLLARLEKQLFL